MGDELADIVVAKEKAPGFLIFVNSFRWITWLLATVVAVLNVAPGFPLSKTIAIYAAVFCYNLVFTFFPLQIEAILRRLPPLILIDVAFSGFLLVIYGQRSPFYVYSFSTVMLGGYLWQMKGSFIVAALMGATYLGATAAGGYSWARLERLNWFDTYIAEFFDYFLIAIFFTYPTYLISRLDKANAGLTAASDAAEKSNKRLTTLQEINAVIQSSLELDEILVRIAEPLVKRLGFDRATVGLVPESGREQIEWLVSYPEPDFARRLQPISSSAFIGRVLLEKKPLVRQNIIVGDPLASALGAGNMVAFPLLVKDGKCLGVIIVDNYRSDAEIDNEDIDLLKTFANEAAAAIGNAQLYSHSHELGKVRERNRIASEMHDNAIQNLHAMRLLLDTCLRDGTDTPATSEKLELLRRIAVDTVGELRSTIDDLFEDRISGESLSVLAEKHAQRVRAAVDIDISIIIEGSEPELEPITKKNIYLILQETISNAVKHSQSKTITVSITFARERLFLKVGDDGVGFSSDHAVTAGSGLGLRTMNNRAESLGGTLKITSKPGSGTIICVDIPSSIGLQTGVERQYPTSTGPEISSA